MQIDKNSREAKRKAILFCLEVNGIYYPEVWVANQISRKALLTSVENTNHPGEILFYPKNDIFVNQLPMQN